MAEYVLLLAASAGTQLMAGVGDSLRQDTLLWAGGAALALLLIVGVLSKPRRW